MHSQLPSGAEVGSSLSQEWVVTCVPGMDCILGSGFKSVSTECVLALSLGWAVYLRVGL